MGFELDISSTSALDSTAAATWDEFVLAHPRSTLYHTSRWVRFAGSVFGFRQAYVVARDAQARIAGVLPLIQQRSFFFGKRWVSLPFFNYGGPLGVTSAHENMLIDAALQTVDAAATFELRDTVAGRPWAVRTDKAAMLRGLPSSRDELGRQLGSKLRSQIRRADREHPVVAVGGAELVTDFFAVFAETMRDLGTPVYPASFFRRLLAELDSDCTLLVVYLNDAPAAVALLTHYRSGTEVPWAASRHSLRSTAVNMRLYWECLCLAIERGSQTFDFGRSTTNSGTYEFKKQWGAQPVPLYWYLPFERNNEVTPREARVVELMRRCWTRLPIPVATKLGGWISPGLPW